MSMFSNSSERRMLQWNILNQQDAERRAEALRQEGQTNAIGAIDAGQPLALASLGQGFDRARTEYGNARSLYDPYVQAGGKALGAMSDASGLNGAEGYDRSTAAFRESPGYRYRVDQATDAVQRAASASGSLGSGNTTAAVLARAGNEADQEFGTYYDRLSGLGQMGYAATGQQANLTRGLGDLGAAQGSAEAGIYSDAAKARAGIYSGMTGLGLSNIQNSANQIGGSVNSYMSMADNASRNSWGLGLGALNSFASLAGLGMGRTGALR